MPNTNADVNTVRLVIERNKESNIQTNKSDKSMYNDIARSCTGLATISI